MPSPLSKMSRARDTVPYTCLMPESAVVSNTGSGGICRFSRLGRQH
jgi:hypothetical protein